MSKVCLLSPQVLLFPTCTKNGKGTQGYFRGGQEPEDLAGRAVGMRAAWLAEGGTDPSCSWFILFLVSEISSDLPWRNPAHTLLLQQDSPSCLGWEMGWSTWLKVVNAFCQNWDSQASLMLVASHDGCALMISSATDITLQGRAPCFLVAQSRSGQQPVLVQRPFCAGPR